MILASRQDLVEGFRAPGAGGTQFNLSEVQHLRIAFLKGRLPSMRSYFLKAYLDTSDFCAIDGVIGNGTIAAMRSFQQAKGLPVGQLILKTLDALGVQLRRK